MYIIPFHHRTFVDIGDKEDKIVASQAKVAGKPVVIGNYVFLDLEVTASQFNKYLKSLGWDCASIFADVDGVHDLSPKRLAELLDGDHEDTVSCSLRNQD